MQIPEKISEEVIYENPWRKIILKTLEVKKWIIHTYPISSHIDEKIATMVFPLNKNKEVIFCKEWRPWIEDFIYNFPVWIKEKYLTFEENAKKELKEEVWVPSENIVYLWKTIVANYDNTIIKYFLALDCEEQEQELEEWEIIEVQKCSISEFEQKIISLKINCPLTISCFSLAKLKGLI